MQHVWWGRHRAAQRQAGGATPELMPLPVALSCAAGAWGPAVANISGPVTVNQLRALDWGLDNPLANHTIVTIYHPEAGGSCRWVSSGPRQRLTLAFLPLAASAGNGHPFASVTFTGFIGSVTSYGGFVGMSEKVRHVEGWMRAAAPPSPPFPPSGCRRSGCPTTSPRPGPVCLSTS